MRRSELVRRDENPLDDLDDLYDPIQTAAWLNRIARRSQRENGHDQREDNGSESSSRTFDRHNPSCGSKHERRELEGHPI
jgi:hypothetical protein